MKGIDSINAFVDTMLESKDEFEKIKLSFEQKRDDLKKAIDSFTQNVRELYKTRVQIEDENMQKLYDQISGELGKMLEGVKASADKEWESIKFITKYEQSFNVAVFGKVKAGKSYLGNFIMGNVIRNLGIASSYDKVVERPKVEVHDRGKVTTQDKLSEIEPSEEGKEEFLVDPNEATRAIQLFRLGGLTWFDTPGIGSVTWENEMLAKEYVDNADLIVYTSNSDAAGTQQDFKEMKELYEKGKKFLLLLTQSDTVEEDMDEDEEIIDVLVPKSDKDRSDLEDYMCEELRKNGISGFSQGENMLTVSTKLALTALEYQDEDMFASSNIGRFLDILKEITRNEGADLKRRTPGDRIHVTVREVIGKLSEAGQKLQEYRRKLLDAKQRQSEHGGELLTQMKHECLRNINRIIRQKVKDVEDKGESISEKELTQILSGEVYKVLQKTCIGEFAGCGDILSRYTEQLRLEGVGELKMRTEEIAYIQKKAVRRERDPDGLWENICSFFGKTYYRSAVETVVKKSEVQLGVNEKQIMELAKDSLEKLFESEVPDMMKKICSHIAQPMIEMQEQAAGYIEDTISRLEKILRSETPEC